MDIDELSIQKVQCCVEGSTGDRICHHCPAFVMIMRGIAAMLATTTRTK